MSLVLQNEPAHNFAGFLPTTAVDGKIQPAENGCEPTALRSMHVVCTVL